MSARIRKLRLALLTLAVVLFAGFIGVHLLKPRPNPQLYSGKTIHEWVMTLDGEPSKQAQNEQAAYQLSKIGAPVIPGLVQILERRPNSPLERVRLLAARWHFIPSEPMRLEDQHFRAIRAAYNLVERGDVNISSLVPFIVYDFTNTTYYFPNESPRALAAAGPAGISVLTNLLVIGTDEVRDQSAYGLHFAASRRTARPQFPEMFDALARAATYDTNGTVRVTAALGLRYAPTNVVFPVALRFLNSTNGYERWAGASILSPTNLSDELKAALQKALNDPEQRVQDAARRALRIPLTNNPVRQ